MSKLDGLKKKHTEDKGAKETNDQEIQDLKVKLARALADYDNLRKRTELEKEVWIKFAGERILISLLPVLDNLEAVLTHLQDQGLAIAVSEFKKVFSEEGLLEIAPKKGDVFDHELHEAVEVEKGGKKDIIADVALNGWKFKDGKVIRYAKVKVYQG